MSRRPDLHLAGVLLAVAIGLSACAGPGAPEAAAAGGAAGPAAARAPDRVAHCFRPRDIWSWRAVGEDTVCLRSNANRTYRLQLMGPCPDVDWAQRLGVKSFGGTMICSAIDAEIIAPSTIGRRRCPVNALQELTAAEAAALPKGERP